MATIDLSSPTAGASATLKDKPIYYGPGLGIYGTQDVFYNPAPVNFTNTTYNPSDVVDFNNAVSTAGGNLPAGNVGTANNGTANTAEVAQTPLPTIPALNLNIMTADQIEAKWKEFLDRATADPDIINYYNKLLEISKNNTDTAISLLETDWSTGVRQTRDTLAGALESLGITFGTEGDTLLNALNKRGIAVSQVSPYASNQLAYAGAGQAQTEVQKLTEDQRLRREATERTANQTIENLGLAKVKGETQQQQALTESQMNIQKQKEQDIASRAQRYMDWWSKQMETENQQKTLNWQQQYNQLSATGSTGGTSSGASTANVNPNDAGSIKAAYPGYAGWNDTNAIIADYKATGGSGKA